MRLFVAALAIVVLANVAATVVALQRSSNAVTFARQSASARTMLRESAERDLSAFERHPSYVNLVTLQGDVADSPAQVSIVDRLVGVLANRDLPANLENALVADLAQYDATDTIRWLHQLNVVARFNPTAEGPAIVKRTAKACWLVLALRPNYGEAGIDLTRMDLRTDAAFVGQAMNLTHIDFAGAVLAPGTWRASNLSDSNFRGASAAGRLTCVRCTFGGHVVEGARLQDGRWVLLLPGKPPAYVD
jgi:hypothetical protein